MTAFALGLVIGSFLNVCIHRWPLGQSVVAPRSRCPRCSSPIAWYDNLPLLSYALLRGRCRHCNTRISLRYPLVELITGTAFALISAQFGGSTEALRSALFVSLLTIAFFTDREHFILPNQVTVRGLALGILSSPFVSLPPGLATIGYFFAGKQPPVWQLSLSESLLSALAFGGTFYVIGETYFRLRSVDGLGLGDVKLVAMIAAFLGSAEALLTVLVGCLLAMVIGGALILVRSDNWRTTPLPLGSYLSAAAFGSVFFGNAILNRYWEFMNG